MILQRGVAFFDSGLGGLNVLQTCIPYLLGLPAYYYGDNAHAPYGNKSKSELAPRVYKAFEEFERLQVRAAVIACNTVTALFLEELCNAFSFPIVGTVPALDRIAGETGEILVLATSATVSSLRARAGIDKENIRFVACKELAGEIERRLGDPDYDFTPFLPQATPSAVVLGCTHYAFIRNQIENFYGCKAIDGHRQTALRLKKILQNSLQNDERFCATLSSLKKEKLPSSFSQKPLLKSRNFFRSFSSRQPLYFLGSGQLKNCHFYKRMFVFNPKG